ncbi:Cytochrome c oxidase copper chaperone 1 [Sesamum angolense]|uniref:Cytochrome c oxidase copper chaperone 1 n=1 Tax=Sesamum angolense TaxID=2727404 RepID=A0AAE1W5K6_9LAMI|nr:Cytochrome c oxidase copper chaperone 1 [Sesamum angolense]
MGGLPIQNSSSVISLQSQKDQRSETVASGPDSKPRKKICCACPETKKLRDECIVEHGEAACGKWIEAHRKCLRAEGFNAEYSFETMLIENKKQPRMLSLQ